MIGRKKTTLKIKGSIRKLRLTENDLLVVTFPGRLTQEELHRLYDALITNANHKHVLVLDSDAKIDVLERGDDYGVNDV